MVSLSVIIPNNLVYISTKDSSEFASRYQKEPGRKPNLSENNFLQVWSALKLQCTGPCGEIRGDISKKYEVRKIIFVVSAVSWKLQPDLEKRNF